MTDLRAGAALVIAGLAASGTTEIYGVDIIERGYASLETKLEQLGADIKRIGSQEEIDVFSSMKNLHECSKKFILITLGIIFIFAIEMRGVFNDCTTACSQRVFFNRILYKNRKAREEGCRFKVSGNSPY